MRLEKEKLEKYALVQEALAEAYDDQPMLVPAAASAVAGGAVDGGGALAEELRENWRSLQHGATVVGSLAWDLKPFCAVPAVWHSEIALALRQCIRKLASATNDAAQMLTRCAAAAGVALVSSPPTHAADRSVADRSVATVQDLCSQSQGCVRSTARELGRLENLLTELHRQLVLLANGLPCPGLDGQRIDKPTAHSVVPLQLEGKAASHRERVTDNVPSSIPIDYLGHYTVLGKVDVTQGLEPNTKIIGYFFFGTLEVIGSSQSLLCPQLKRLRTSKGWVTWRPTLLEKIDASTAWVAEAAPEDSAQTAQSPVAAQTNAADISTTSETETADEPPAVDDLEDLPAVVYNPAFLPTPDSSGARLHVDEEPTYGVTVPSLSTELVLQLREDRMVVIDVDAGSTTFDEHEYSSIRNWQFDPRAAMLSLELGGDGVEEGAEGATGPIRRYGTSDGLEIVRTLEAKKGVPQSPGPVPLPEPEPEPGPGPEPEPESLPEPVPEPEPEPEHTHPARRLDEGPKTLAAPEMAQRLEAAAALALAQPDLGEDAHDSLVKLPPPPPPPPPPAAPCGGAARAPGLQIGSLRHQEMVQVVARMLERVRGSRGALELAAG